MSGIAKHGTRQYSPSGNGSKAEVSTGKASGAHLLPPLPAWMADPRRKCADKPTGWWYAPELDEDGTQLSGKVEAEESERLCGLCDLNLECREFGLRHERHGRWGGVKVDPLNAKTRERLLAGVDHERERRRRRTA